MSDGPRLLTTDEQRERLHTARRRGGLCAACGRVLEEGELVYMKRLVIDIPRPAGERVGGYRATMVAPVGVECASPAFLTRVEEREPERCAGCDRPVYYSAGHPDRQQALCSRACRSRAANAARHATRERDSQ